MCGSLGVFQTALSAYIQLHSRGRKVRIQRDKLHLTKGYGELIFADISISLCMRLSY